ncbi:MAG: hypothetical protein NZO58_14125, partial [Gemmataceae bacterium]|nr:hypothetical protein [Gemmataceae bacterium]
MAEYRRGELVIFFKGVIFLALATAAPPTCLGQEAAAICNDVKGALLTSGASGWRAIKAGDVIAAGTRLTSMFEAQLSSANKAVGVKLVGDVGMFGPLSVLESSITVLKADKADFSFDFLRGLVVMTNTKAAGSATVKFKMHDENFTLHLKTPGSKLGIELYGRHPGGADNISKDQPTLFFYALAVEGEATLVGKEHTYEFKSPPGHAGLHWDSATRRGTLEFLEKFPPELRRNEQQLKEFALICKYAEALASNDPAAAAGKLTAADDPWARRVGVTGLGAIDQPEGVLAALDNTKHKDVREQAVLVLRSWLGRSPGQIAKLQQAMLKNNYPPPRVKITLQLLIGFDAQERDRPAVYEL